MHVWVCVYSLHSMFINRLERHKGIWIYKATAALSCVNSVSSFLVKCYRRYPKREVHNLARFISVAKFRPLSWRLTHPYILADRFEDITSPEVVHKNPNCDRNITVYGYLRGRNMRKGTQVLASRPNVFLAKSKELFS